MAFLFLEIHLPLPDFFLLAVSGFGRGCEKKRACAACLLEVSENYPMPH